MRFQRHSQKTIVTQSLLMGKGRDIKWRFSTAWYGTVRLSPGRFAFPLQFSTAIEWVELFTRRYNCAASTAVTSS